MDTDLSVFRGLRNQRRADIGVAADEAGVVAETPSRSTPTHQIEPSLSLLPADSCMTSRETTVWTIR